MPNGQQKKMFWRLFLGIFSGMGMLLGLIACKPSRPVSGVFPVKVIVLTNDQAGIPNASIQINSKEIGKTDKYGTFVGTHKGKVGEFVRIKVVAGGKDNFGLFKKPLKMRKTPRGWIPVEIKVNAFLGPSSVDSDSNNNNTVATAKTPGEPASDNTNKKSAGTVDNPEPRPRVAEAQPTERPKNRTSETPEERREPARTTPEPQPTAPEERRDVAVARTVQPEDRRTEPVTPPIQPQTPDPTPTPPPAASGKYEISLKSNVANTRVFCKGCRRRSLGKIVDAGGALVYTHTDKRSTPRSLQFTFRLQGSVANGYKDTKIEKELNIESGREKYEVDAMFEKHPPIRISVSANVGGIQVYLNRKMQGEISSASQPYVIEYTNHRSRRVSIELRPTEKGVKPRRVTKTVTFKKGEYNYTVEATFKTPEPKVAQADPTPAPTNPPNPPPQGTNNSDGPPMPSINTPPSTPTPPEPRPSLPAGNYKITITSNAAGILVFRGSRKLGEIPDAGGSLVYTHKDKRANPKPLVFKFRAKNKFAYTESQKTMNVALEAGRSEYQVEVSFDKQKAIQISLKSNVPGVTVYVNGKSAGSISGGSPLVYEYRGKSIRTATVEFRSPNPRLFRPARVREKLTLERGRFEYEVTGNFTEFDPGDSVVLKPKCLKSARGSRRVVVLKAVAGTRFLLKGDCDETLAKAGKNGQIRVSMPVGTFQRVWGMMGDTKTQKVFEVVTGGGPQIVAFSDSRTGCHLKRIKKKIINKIPLEEEEVTCLKNVKSSDSAEYFSAQLFLARFYCQQKMMPHGRRLLDGLGKNAQNRFDPYRSLQIGIEFGRCKEFPSAVTFLRYTEQRINRFSASDRTQNRIALYRAMSTIFEQLYYRRKNAIDLTRALKSAERLTELSSGDEQEAARKEVARLKKMITQKGGLDD